MSFGSVHHCGTFYSEKSSFSCNCGVLLSVPAWVCGVGMPLVHVIQVLKTQPHVLKHADVIFSQSSPLEADLQVDLRESGILLKFDPCSQRLKVRGLVDRTADILTSMVAPSHCATVNRCV